MLKIFKFVFLGIVAGWLATNAILAAEEDEALLFSVGFDTYSVDADISHGEGKASEFTEPDLQLRMFPGVAGKGNALVLANTEFCRYEMPGNFDPRQGTISIWINAQNWHLSDEPWQIFFHAQQRHFQMQICKVWRNYILANIRLVRQPGQERTPGGQVQIRIEPEQFKSGRWYKLDVVWNEHGMKFYLDGALGANRYNMIVGEKTVPPNVQDKQFPEPLDLPEAAGNGWFSLGVPTAEQKRATIQAEDRTALDEVKIYNRMLSAAEIRAAYEAVIPPQEEKDDAPNLVTVPRAGGIELDGRIEGSEWGDATTAPIILPSHNPYSIVPATFYTKHDGEHLYVAFEQSVPCLQAVNMEADSRVWDDDSFEFHLRSETTKSSYQFIVNGNAALFDQRDLNKGWNSLAGAASHKGEEFWSAELAIPIASLGGLETLLEDQWSANFCATFNDPVSGKQNHTVWNPGVFTASGRIIFSDEAVACRLENLGALRSGRMDLLVTVTPEARGYTATGSIVQEGWSTQEYPGNLLGHNWKRALTPGKQKLTVSVTKGEKERLYYSKTFVANRPLELRHDNDPQGGAIDVELDFSSAGAAAAAQLAADGIPVRLSLVNQAGGVLSSAKVTAKGLVSRVRLERPEDINSGTYTIEACTEGDGTKFDSEIIFRVPDLTPYRRKLMAGPEVVPPPWVPVEVEGNTRFRVLEREYEFDGTSPFPKQVICRGEKMLAEPPRLLLDSGDGEREPQWTEVEVVDVFSGRADLAGRGRVGNLAIEWTGQLHFDGLYLVDLRLVPEQEAKIDSMTMKWRVTGENAKFFLTPQYVPWQDGYAESDLLPKSNRKDNMLWLSGHEKGFLWWTESNANWVNKPEENPLTAMQDGDTVEAILKVISSPATLTTEIGYLMGFMATPSRRPPENFRAKDNTMGWGRSKGCNVQYVAGGPFANRKFGDDLTSINSLKPAYPEEFAESMASYRERNIKAIVYNMPGDLCDLEADYDWLGKAGLNMPGRTHSGTKLGNPWVAYKYCGRMAGGLIADLWAYNLDLLLESQPDCSGLYYDCGSVSYCSNPRHGCGGIDAFGKHYITSEALGLREIMLRTYAVAKSHDPENLMMHHSHIQFSPLVHSFADVWFPGENTFRLISQNLEHGYCEDISLEEYQSNYNWRNKGVAVSMMAQHHRAAIKIPALKHLAEECRTEPRFALSAMAPFLVHDLNIAAAYVSYEMVEKWWQIKEQVNLGKVRDYHGYWNSDAVSSDSPKVLCGWYEWDEPMPYLRMLVVSNLGREDQPAALKLDKAALRIAGKAVEYIDLWNDDSIIAEEDLAELTVGGNNFLLIGIRAR